MLRTLQLTLKWPTSLDSLIDFSLWTSKHHSISYNWLFKAIKLLCESGLQFDFPDHTFLELMPNEACLLVSLSSDLAVLESRSWLKSAFWCLSQVVDPFYNFQYTWNDLKLMGLVATTGKTPSWFQTITSLSNPTLYLPKQIGSINITSFLLSLVKKLVNTIDTSFYIRLCNKYYWIAGVDSSGSLIFGRAFYTFDDDSGTHSVTPCFGCSLHCLDMDEGLLALKTVGGKLIHHSCLSVLPSYHYLQLYQMTVHVDISQQIINLKLSLFILCSYFRFLLRFSELYIPERYLAITQPPLMHCDSSPALLPDLTPVSNPAFALRLNTIFHLSGAIHVIDSLNSLLVFLQSCSQRFFWFYSQRSFFGSTIKRDFSVPWSKEQSWMLDTSPSRSILICFMGKLALAIASPLLIPARCRGLASFENR
ncbi:hypothetical protein RhiirC2_854777 [Rhizophagus irregularis]|uniref:Uncharacterized protein n=1 Tax=Rhizophagus irregularis TaxID=588596 RepID=A0A2N1MQB2_9GLOM|nr:hypothetical protein RhiirC2_854777 [Rhizophagus irregularis]